MVISSYSMAGENQFVPGNEGIEAEQVRLSPEAEQVHFRAGVWGDSILNTMSLDEKIGQLFMIGAYSNLDSKYNSELEGVINKYHPGGIFFFPGYPVRQSVLTNKLQASSKIPMLVGMDTGWNGEMNTDSVPALPSAMVLGSLVDNKLVYRAGAIAAMRLRMIGVHLSFASIPGDPDNHTGNRSLHNFFGDNKTIAAEKAQSYIMGMRENGIMVVLKDFKIPANISAGMIFLPGNLQTSIDSAKKAIHSRKINRTDIDAYVKKILLSKYLSGLNHYRPAEIGDAERIKQGEMIGSICRSVYENSITLFRDQDRILPVRNLDTLDFASLSFGFRDNNFQDMLGRYAPFRHYVIDQSQMGTEIFTDLAGQLANNNLIIAGIPESIFRADSNERTAREILLFLSGLESRARVVIVIFGSPQMVKYFSGFRTVLCAYEYNQYTEMAVPQAIFGSIPVTGKCPVTLDKLHHSGFGLETSPIGRLGFALPGQVGFNPGYLKYIDTIAIEAIRKGATPGCQVLVAKNGKVVVNRSYGYYTWDSARLIDENSLFDLASITKVAATLQAIMILYEKHIIDLDKKISCYLPELRNTNKEDIIIRDLLTHQSGIQPYIPFWKRTIRSKSDRNKYYSETEGQYYSQLIIPGIYGSRILTDSIWSWIVASPLREKNDPARPYDYKYSDIGYYILHRMVERLINQPLDEFLAQNFYDPLGMRTMTYLPGEKFTSEKIVPSSRDNYFRNTTLQGYVQDELAALYGGVAGHAGLFSNAYDLAILMQMHLQHGSYGGARYFFPSTVEEFAEQQYKLNRRGLGWDKPDLTGNGLSPASGYASSSSFGHSGFTGTMVWADPENELIYIFLSNRTYPDIENKKLSDLDVRKRIQTVIYSSLLKH